LRLKSLGLSNSSWQPLMLDAQAQNFQRDLLKLREDLEREREREHQRQGSKRQRLKHDLGKPSWLSVQVGSLVIDALLLSF
jgi:homospermidine synthase